MELLFTDTGDGGELSFVGGDIETCDSFYTAIYHSLFCGDAFYNVYEKYETNNDVEKALNETITKQHLQNVEAACKNALKWFLESDIAETLDVRAYGDDNEKINVDITITEPSNVSHLYGITWENQKAVLRCK